MQTEAVKVYLAVDLGASSGRVMAAMFNGLKIELKEVHRFQNGSEKMADGYHWDIYKLFASIKEGLKKAAEEFGDQVVSIGIDTWGVDYGLLDSEGKLMGLPFAYRDSRTNGMQEELDRRLSLDEIYKTTGIQFMFFNTLNQLMAEVISNRSEFKQAKQLLFTPDLLNYWLCGKAVNEYTIASTSQLLDVEKRDWAYDMLDKLGIPISALGEITMPGVELGKLLPEVVAETGLKNVSVDTVGGHDTASAVAAVPTSGEESYAYLSSGTWSLMGVESNQPVVNERSFEYGFTNEGGIGGKIRLLKNITGLWLVQECRRNWLEAGEEVSFAELGQEASQVKPFMAFINPDDPMFAEPCDMPRNIQIYCGKTNQAVPQTRGEIIRVALESLAMRYKSVFGMLEDLVGRRIAKLHIVGGGTRDRLLNQLTANAINRPIIAGPIEATAIGNAMVQMMAAGDIKDLSEGRRIVRDSFEQQAYSPTDCELFAKAYTRFHDITGV